MGAPLSINGPPAECAKAAPIACLPLADQVAEKTRIHRWPTWCSSGANQLPVPQLGRVVLFHTCPAGVHTARSELSCRAKVSLASCVVVSASHLAEPLLALSPRRVTPGSGVSQPVNAQLFGPLLPHDAPMTGLVNVPPPPAVAAAVATALAARNSRISHYSAPRAVRCRLLFGRAPAGAGASRPQRCALFIPWPFIYISSIIYY
jgi:hypothetical protein